MLSRSALAPGSAVGADDASQKKTAAEDLKSPKRPRKRINSLRDFEVFNRSPVCDQLLNYAVELSEEVRNKPIVPDRLGVASPLICGLVGILDEVHRWIEEFPPIVQPMRFGNKAFRQWHSKLIKRSRGLLEDLLAEAAPSVAVDVRAELSEELGCYLCAAFGDERRIDYGTGHEAAFLALLFVLGSAGIAAKSDAEDLVLLVFETYMKVMRRLQSVYSLEPAGSHGVWGLDDFHALPFLFGSAQLIGMEEEIPPGKVYLDPIVQAYSDKFLYVDAIRQVLLAKRSAAFHETSPMLYDITAVPTWSKIHSGMAKLYRAEVLGKFPVIQHFLFGRSIPWPGDFQEALR